MGKRRRQGKTDFYARRRLTCQRKNKYDSKKYRLVVRRTCSKIITQIIYSTMTGDKVLCAADSQELKAHGLTAGLTNYSACYATGLLLARRLLKQVGLAEEYKANGKVDGEMFLVECEGEKRPFKALLMLVSKEPPLVPESSEPSRVLAMEVLTFLIPLRDSQVTPNLRSRSLPTREERPLIPRRPKLSTTLRSTRIESSVDTLLPT